MNIYIICNKFIYENIYHTSVPIGIYVADLILESWPFNDRFGFLSEGRLLSFWVLLRLLYSVYDN